MPSHGGQFRKGSAEHTGQEHESPLWDECPARRPIGAGPLLTHPRAGKSPPICPSVGARSPSLLRPRAVPGRHCGYSIQRAARHAGALKCVSKWQIRGEEAPESTQQAATLENCSFSACFRRTFPERSESLSDHAISFPCTQSDKLILNNRGRCGAGVNIFRRFGTVAMF